MKFSGALAAIAILATTVAPSTAQQERRTTTEQDVTTQGTVAAPETGADIVLPFGRVSQIYFKRPFRSIRLSDPQTVSAAPQTDHIIAFTGLFPGRSIITLESPDGKSSTDATLLVTRPIHEVKIYAPSASKDAGPRSAVTIVNGGEQAKEADEADYRSQLCNEIGCVPVPKAGR